MAFIKFLVNNGRENTVNSQQVSRCKLAVCQRKAVWDVFIKKWTSISNWKMMVGGYCSIIFKFEVWLVTEFYCRRWWHEPIYLETSLSFLWLSNQEIRRKKIIYIHIKYFITLNVLQKLGSLHPLSSTSVTGSWFSDQTTAVTDEVKTTLSMVSTWAHASSTLCAALTSISTMSSCIMCHRSRQEKRRRFACSRIRQGGLSMIVKNIS